MRLHASSPVLSRPCANGIELQVGIARPAVLRELGIREFEFVTSLEGGRPVSPAEARRFARVISLLTVAGAWADTPRPPRAAAALVHGAGALGMEIAAALVRVGLDVALRDHAPAGVEPAGTYGEPSSGTCAGVAARTLAARGVEVRVGGGGERLGIEVCFGSPDPIQMAAWMRDDVPHVLAVCDGETVWVSHVIVPGATACSRCRDVVLTSADPAWPVLALQLGAPAINSRRPATTALAAITVAARVAGRVSLWLETGDVGCAERVGGHGSLSPEALEARVECGCGAFGANGDEVAAKRAAWPVPRG